MPRTHPGLCRAVCRCGLPGLRELPLTLYDPLSDPGRAELPAPFPSCTAFSQVCRWVAHSCRVKTTLSWTPGKFSPDLCRRGKNDSSWETRGSHLLRWVKMRSPVASKSRRTGWGSSWVLLVRSRRSWALGVCVSSTPSRGLAREGARRPLPQGLLATGCSCTLSGHAWPPVPLACRQIQRCTILGRRGARVELPLRLRAQLSRISSALQTLGFSGGFIA